MRRPKRVLPLLLAIASGLATAALLHSQLVSTPEVAVVELEPMVVAAGPLKDAQPLTRDDLRVTNVADRPQGAFADVSELEGRLPMVAIGPGQPILSSHLAPVGAQPGLWHRIPPGKRAVTVAIDEVVGVGGFLKPGLAVDVIAVMKPNNTPVTRTIVQNVPILAVAQNDEEEKDSTRPKVAPSATLLVTPEQAESIALATEEGQIRLVLRAPGDKTIVKRKEPPRVIKEPRVTRVIHVTRPAPAAPAAAPVAPPAPGIEVIRGDHDPKVIRP